MSIPEKISMLYLDEQKNDPKEDQLISWMQNTASNDHDISVDLDYYFDLSDDLPPSMFAGVFLTSRLFVIVVIVVLLGAIGHNYKQQIESFVELKMVLYSATNIEAGSKLEKISHRGTEIIDNVLQKHTDSRSSFQPKQTITTITASELVAELEKISYRIITANRWQPVDVSLFAEYWNLLDRGSRAEVKQTIWFQHFSFKLGREVRKLTRAESVNDSRITLARKLGVVKTEIAKIDKGRISNRELHDNVARFIQAYEDGDIKNLSKLFSGNIISNNGTTKAGILKDFVDLFSSSSKRKITIKDISWKYVKTHAKGIGIINTVVVMNDKRVKVEKGKIQFVMKKFNNKLQMTHLYRRLINE